MVEATINDRVLHRDQQNNTQLAEDATVSQATSHKYQSLSKHLLVCYTQE